MDRTSARHRYVVVALLILLFTITYLDRVCISVAGPRMQEDLHIGPSAWGWVSAIFTLAYCIFEIPSGALGDRIGARRVLTRIVLWWSAFTAMTGLVTGQILPAFIGAILGIPGGVAVYAGAKSEGSTTVPPVLWLVAMVLGTILVLAALTTIPARVGARRSLA